MKKVLILEGGIVIGSNASSLGDVKQSDAMQKAFDMGKSIK